MISSSQRPLTENTQHSQQTDIHAPGGIRTNDHSRRATADLRLRPSGHWDQHNIILKQCKYLRTTIYFIFLLSFLSSESELFVSIYISFLSILLAPETFPITKGPDESNFRFRHYYIFHLHYRISSFRKYFKEDRRVADRPVATSSLSDSKTFNTSPTVTP